MNCPNWTHVIAVIICVGVGAVVMAMTSSAKWGLSLAEAVAIGTLVNTCIVTYIGYRQHKISLAQKHLGEAKHRADLFDRRFAVFQATQKVLSKVLVEGTCNYQDVHEFTPWTQQAYFLFDDAIHVYLLEVRKKLIGMASTSEQMKDGADPGRYQEALRENHDLLVWLTDQLNMDKDALFSRFRPYLRH